MLPPMSTNQQVFIGTDCGATMSKVGGVWADGTTVSTKLLQRPTNSQQGPHAVVNSWVAAVSEYLEQNKLTWAEVASVGLAIPGPYLRYGVLGHSACVVFGPLNIRNGHQHNFEFHIHVSNFSSRC